MSLSLPPSSLLFFVVVVFAVAAIVDVFDRICRTDDRVGVDCSSVGLDVDVDDESTGEIFKGSMFVVSIVLFVNIDKFCIRVVADLVVRDNNIDVTSVLLGGFAVSVTD